MTKGSIKQLYLLYKRSDVMVRTHENLRKILRCITAQLAPSPKYVKVEKIMSFLSLLLLLYNSTSADCANGNPIFHYGFRCIFHLNEKG